MIDADFGPDRSGLERALELLVDGQTMSGSGSAAPLPDAFPPGGIGPAAALESLFSPVLGDARQLGSPGFFAHMDPPTPWITWAMHMWTASRNQNLLHPDTAPTARDLEQRVVAWLVPEFGMSGGHMTPGSTVANITAVWAAREAGATEVVSGPGAHLSVRKAAHLLGLPHRGVDDWGDPGDVSDAIVVITAGTTSTGEIEPLDAAPSARWRHVDAAWAGPLRLSDRHRHLLDGIEAADSVAVSAHKWLFQPKESALILFADVEAAHESISVDGAYLAVPNVGLLGSHGAVAVPLLATLLAYGRTGIADVIDRSMELADDLWRQIEAHAALDARTTPQSGVVCWRHREATPADILRALSADVFVSTTVVDGEPWLRSVAANPMADPALVVGAVLDAAALSRAQR